jgi:hypothetical protein
MLARARAEGGELALGEKRAFFRTVRRLGYAAMGIFIVALLLVVWGEEGGTFGDTAQGVDLFIPLPQLMFVLLFGAILLNITGAVFGALEIHAASSGEQRYIIARHSYVTGLATTAFAAFFLIVILMFVPYIDDQMDFERQLELGYSAPQGRISAPFNVSKDPTGSSYLNWVDINSSDGRVFTVTVYYHDDYDELNDTNNRGRELVIAENVSWFHFDLADENVVTTPVRSGAVIRQEPTQPLESRDYFIVVDRKEVNSSRILYLQDRVLDAGFIGSVTWLLVAIMAVNGAAAVYNRMVREKWRAYGVRNY